MELDILIVPKYHLREEVFANLQSTDNSRSLEQILAEDFSLLSLKLVEESERMLKGLRSIIQKSKDGVYFITVTARIQDCDSSLISCYEGTETAEKFWTESKQYCHHLLLLEESSGEATLGNFSYIPWREKRDSNQEVLYLIQNIAPGSKSGQHKHCEPSTPSRETYVSLFGEPELNSNNKVINLKRKEAVVVEPGQAHQIRNYGNCTAQNLLVMNPAPEGREDRIETETILPW